MELNNVLFEIETFWFNRVWIETPRTCPLGTLLLFIVAFMRVPATSLSKAATPVRQSVMVLLEI